MSQATVIKIKNSDSSISTGKFEPIDTSTSSSILEKGELAFTYRNGKLWIGPEAGKTQDPPLVLGGTAFTDLLDHAVNNDGTPNGGTLNASSAVVVDGNKKINEWLVDNLKLDANTLSSINTDGDIILNPNGVGSVVIDSDLEVTGSQTFTGNTNISSLKVSDLGVTNGVVFADATGELLDNTSFTFTPTGTVLTVDNIQVDGNAISTTTGNLELKPFSGSSVHYFADADFEETVGTNHNIVGVGSIEVGVIKPENSTDNLTLTLADNQSEGLRVIDDGASPLNYLTVSTSDTSPSVQVHQSLFVDTHTANRVAVVNSSGELVTNNNLKWDSDKLVVDSITLNGNTISAANNLILDPDSNGLVRIQSDQLKTTTSGENILEILDSSSDALFEVGKNGNVTIAGVLTVEGTGSSSMNGDLTVIGNTQLGDESSDDIDFVGEIVSDIIPRSTTQSIGTTAKPWNNANITNLNELTTVNAPIDPSTAEYQGIALNAGVLTINADLVVNGDTTTLQTTNSEIKDNLIALNRYADGNIPSNNGRDSGVVIQRGSAEDNALLFWDEQSDKMVFALLDIDADFAGGDITYSESDLGTVRASVFEGDLKASQIVDTNDDIVIDLDTGLPNALAYIDIAGGDTNTLVYQDATNSTNFVPTNDTDTSQSGTFLAQNSSGEPVWTSVIDGGTF